jgi:1-pyrroline-5-carboxylate dehydrogenase
MSWLPSSKAARKKSKVRVRRIKVKVGSKIPRVTYATLKITANDDQAYDKAVALVRNKLGSRFTMYINGEEWASTGEEMSHPSPVDTRIVVSYFPKGSRGDAKSAISAARDAFPSWSAIPYQNRIRIVGKAADLMIDRRYELSAWMAFEVGKNRAESLAEVNESAELIRYYCDQMETNKGYLRSLESPGPNQETTSILRPYGVWAVIAPWNFPLSLATGMAVGALVAGNTVVFKPSSESPVLGHELCRALIDAGIPRGVFNFVTGPGATVGAELQENPGVDGLVFTGSKEVGMSVYHGFAKNYPKPVITEMGGKNPAIVTATADLDQAAEGVMRAAFGFGGQKCSACSRVYVDHSVKGKFLDLLVGWTQKVVKIGDPSRKETFLGPMINKAAVETYLRATEEATRDGGRFVYGGMAPSSGEFEHGYFVEPTIVDNLPVTHRLFRDELFVPLLVVAGVESFEEAIKLANDSEYGLCAGIYTKDRKELQIFFDQIQAGVTYANRRAGATTGAWPGVNSFGGWKGSGSSGKSGLGPYYVQQFMREQSRWIVK